MLSVCLIKGGGEKVVCNILWFSIKTMLRDNFGCKYKFGYTYKVKEDQTAKLMYKRTVNRLKGRQIEKVLVGWS